MTKGAMHKKTQKPIRAIGFKKSKHIIAAIRGTDELQIFKCYKKATVFPYKGAVPRVFFKQTSRCLGTKSLNPIALKNQ